jgi:hypothetical protein
VGGGGRKEDHSFLLIHRAGREGRKDGRKAVVLLTMRNVEPLNGLVAIKGAALGSIGAAPAIIYLLRLFGEPLGSARHI